MKASPNKIHIIGSVASGKTTMAKDLSMKLQIPYYELDNVVWKRSDRGDIKWNKHFEQVGKPYFFQTYEKYQNKILVIKNENDLSELLKI